jgi:hypothetical protein
MGPEAFEVYRRREAGRRLHRRACGSPGFEVVAELADHC